MDPNTPPSDNPFDQMVAHGMGTESTASPAPDPSIPENPFDAMVRGAMGTGAAPAPKTSAAGAFASHAIEGVAPTIGGLAGAARGAEVGAIAGAAIPGLGETGIGEAGGAIVGGLIGGFGGGWAASKGQDYAVKALPDNWRDPIEKELSTSEQEHPTASFLGGLFPMAVTMNPFNAAKTLPTNATTMQRIMQNPYTARVFGGAIQGGIEAGQELADGDKLDWQKVAMSTGFGLVFNRPNALGERIEAIGQPAWARAAHGEPQEPQPSPTVPDVEPERQSPDVGDFGDLYNALFPGPKPAPTRYEGYGALGADAPTIYGAWDARVAGPQVTEEVHQGSHEMDPTAKMLAEDAARTEAAVLKPPPPPDVGVAARVMKPELFEEHEAAISVRDALQRQLDEMEPGTPGADAAKARLDKVDAKVDALTEQVAAAHRTAGEAVGVTPMEEPRIVPPGETEPGEAPAARSIAEQRDFIQKDLERRYIAAGRDPEDAAAESHVVADNYVARSKRMKGKIGTPEELYLAKHADIIGMDGKSIPADRPPGREGEGVKAIADNQPLPPMPLEPKAAEDESLRRAAAPEPDPEKVAEDDVARIPTEPAPAAPEPAPGVNWDDKTIGSGQPLRDDMTVMNVPVDALDAAFKRDAPEFHVQTPKDATSEYARAGKPMSIPEVGAVDGKIGIQNGRNRIAVARDMGETVIPIAVEKENAEAVRAALMPAPEPTPTENANVATGVEQPSSEDIRGPAPPIPQREPSEAAPKSKRIRKPRSASVGSGGGSGGGGGEHDVTSPDRNEPSAVPAENDGVSRPPSSDGGGDTKRPDTPAGRAVKGAKERIEERSRDNYRITDADHIGEGSPREKIKGNLAAIRLLKDIEAEARQATPEEKKILVKYTGWGAFSEKMFNERRGEFEALQKEMKLLTTPEEYEAARRSTLNAHYTSPDVIKGMWDVMLNHLGFGGGLALEPSSGVGHFIGLTPDSVASRTAWTATELDSLTGRIAKLLYGGSEVNVQGFETLKRPSNYYDMAISNVPFGDYQLTEKPYGTHSIHDFFFVKSLDKIRPGGIVSFVTSRYTMDKLDGAMRRLLARNADLVGAIRLPGGDKGAFASNAGTQVTTDIIFLRKRFPGEAQFGDAKWMDTKEIQTPEGPTRVNEYFADHPEMMLGEMRLMGSMYRANEPVLIGDSAGLREKIAAAAKGMPANAFAERAGPAPPPITADDPSVASVKDGSYFEKDGQIYRREAGVGVAQGINPDQTNRVSKLIGLRDKVLDVLRAQLAGGVGADEKRADLRKAYDSFVEAHGPINKEVRTVTKRVNKKGEAIERVVYPNLEDMKDDPDVYRIAALENYDRETGKAEPSAIQSRDVIAPTVERQINAPSDALAAVLDTSGRVDLQKIGQLMGAASEDEVTARLGDLIFQNPDGRQWEVADSYLSGNVVKKLEEAEIIAKADPAYQRNVEALRGVQPEKLTAVDITAQLGAPWIPDKHYQAFLQELGVRGAALTRMPMNNEWRIGNGQMTRFGETQWGIDRSDVSAMDIVKAAFNNRPIKVYDRIDRDTVVVNQAKTEEAAVKVAQIRDMFSGDAEKGVDAWAFQDPERAAELEGIYNYQFNNIAKRKFDGAHQTFPGMSSTLQLRPHQKDAVWRVVQNGNTLLDHVVGAGKTYTMIASGMEQKRLGLVTKPAYVVPNSMLEQFSREFLQAYPNAKLLVANKDEMSASARKAFVAKASANDWDAVIMTHSGFGRVPMSDGEVAKFLSTMVDEYDRTLQAMKASGEDKKSPSVKQIEKAKLKMEERMKKLLNTEAKDNSTSFEETGIDHIYLDEAHQFKNLAFSTRRTQVKGLSASAAQRSEDLLMKIRYLDQKRPGRSATFATGTPISNTMAEMWTMLRYLGNDKLKELGLDTFDAWGDTFGKIVTQPELSSDAKTLKDVSSFAKFVNIPELINLWSQVSDSRTADMLNLPRPKVMTRDGKPGIEVVKAEASDQERAYMAHLIGVLDSLKGKRPEPGQPNTLSVVAAGRKVATDGRLVKNGDLGFQGDFEFNPKGKIALAVKNIMDFYKKGKKSDVAKAQMVFLDMGVPKAEKAAAKAVVKSDSETPPDEEMAEGTGDPTQDETSRIDLYADLKARLVAEGIPANEVAFIHDADTDQKKANLFEAVREGKVRVLVGSSSKMGVGVNAQKRLIAMHHLDAPWKPAEVEQRDGRILRQGNLNPEVHILRYITEGSFDSVMWQTLERKAKFIGQVTSGAKGSRIADDVDNPLPEAEMLKAAASGDPRIMQHAELTRQVRQLAAQKRAFEQTRSRAINEAKAAQSTLTELARVLPAAKADASKVTDLAGEKFKVKIGDQEFVDREAAGKHVLASIATRDPSEFWRPVNMKVGEMSGLDMMLQLSSQSANGEAVIVGRLGLKGTDDYNATEAMKFDANASAIGIMRRYEAILRHVGGEPDRIEGRQRAVSDTLQKMTKATQGTWPRDAEYSQAQQKLAQLTEDLKPKKPDVPDVRGRILEQIKNENEGPNSRTWLSDLRKKLPDISRVDFDKAMSDMHTAGDIAMSGSDNPRDVNADRKGGALDYKGETMTQVRLANALAQGPNAKIVLGRDGKRDVITLFKTANASTMLHEEAHRWLRDLLEDAAHPEATDQVRADADTVRNWLKMGREPTTAQHERFADTFEQYLREGVAPTPRLVPMFARLKNRLLDIYKSLKDLWGKRKFEKEVSPDIRAVFDRLLAYEDEPKGTHISPSMERGKTLADIHEQDAAEITNPFEAGAAAMRIDNEAARHEADVPPEIAHEIQAAVEQVEAEQAEREGKPTGGGEGADASGGVGSGAEPSGQVDDGSGKPEPEPERGLVGVQPSEELSGERKPVGQGGASSSAESERRPDDGNATRPGAPPTPRPARTLDGIEPNLDKAGNIRLDTLTTREHVAQAIRAAAAANDGFIGDRRGVITDGQVSDLADALGMDVDMLSKRKLGQAFNAEQVVAARRLLLQSADDVGMKMRAAAIGTDEDVMAYAMAKDRHQMIQAQVAGITAEAGRALRAFRNITGSMGENQALATNQFIKKATGKTLYQLREEAKLGSALDTPEKVSKMTADAIKRNFGDMVLEYWINGLISGPATHVTYSIGNTILAAVKAGPETAVAAAIGGARRAAGRQGEYVRPGEVGARLRGAVRGLPSAFQAAAESFGRGVTARLPGEKGFEAPFQPESGLAKTPDLNQGATYADAAAAAFANVRGLRDGLVSGAALLAAGGIKGEPIFGSRFSPLGTIPDFTYRGVNVAPLGSAARLPSRFIAAIHGFFRATNFSMEKSALAYRAASEQGLIGAKFEAEVGRLWQNPTDEMMKQASHESTEATLMGQGGEFTQALAKLTNARVFGLKLGKFIDPFVRISSNIIEQTLIARTPIGILSPEIRADLAGKNGNVAQDTAQARMLVGTALAATFGGLAASGYASGSGPTDPRKSAMWRLAGNQAHSVRIGDVWYDVHRLGPMGMLMSVAADMYDVAHAAESGDMLLAGAVLQHAITQNILDESFMKGPADLIQAMEDPGRYGEAYLRNWASSFVPYSVGMAQMARASDPYSRQARTVMDAIKAKIPGESETLFPRRDVWGRPIPNPDALIAAGVTSIYEKQMSRDPVNIALLNLGISPATLERKVRNVQLDDAQYDDFQRIAGFMTKQRLDTIVNSGSFQSWPSHVQADVITEVLRQSREAARGVLMTKYPQIMSEAFEAKRAKFAGDGR